MLVRGNVDGVVLGQLHAARGASSDKRVGGQRRGVRLLKKKRKKKSISKPSKTSNQVFSERGYFCYKSEKTIQH